MEKQARGYIFAGLTLVALLAVSAVLLGISAAEKAMNSKKIANIQAQYLAEGMVGIAQGLMFEQLGEKRLMLLYAYDNPEEAAGRIPIDSEALYQNEPALDFGKICTDVLQIVAMEGNADMSCRIAVINRTSNELKLHVLDGDGVLYDMTEYDIGALLPVKYGMVVSYAGVELETIFTISGATFTLAADDEYGLLTVALSTDNAVITTETFKYTGG